MAASGGGLLLERGAAAIFSTSSVWVPPPPPTPGVDFIYEARISAAAASPYHAATTPLIILI